MLNHLTIDYPDTLPDFLQESREEFERNAKMAMAVKLFEMKKIPSGTAAELVGLDRVSFLLRLRDFGVSMMNIDESELTQDVANA